MFEPGQVEQFNRDGFLVVRQLADSDTCATMRGQVLDSIAPPLGPAEFETDVQYPGAPTDRLSEGGDTPRRLLHAYTRHQVFRDWATSTAVVGRLRQLMSGDEPCLSQNHHNCVMTKHPGYSSSTSWHQDIRYWQFDRPELISVWLALGDERPDNGGMSLIPGSHTLSLDRGRFDAALFLRQDVTENRALIDSAIAAELAAGDALFFHCRTLHAAGRNAGDRVKLSVVFTYHDRTNRPIAGTRSANYPDIPCTG